MAAQLVRASSTMLRLWPRGCIWQLAQRRIASGSAGETPKSNGKKTTPVVKGSSVDSKAYDLNVYRVEEYFSYNEFSYYDLEKDMAAGRLIQPDPKKAYVHSNPWKSDA